MCEIKVGDYVKTKGNIYKVVNVVGELLKLEEFYTGCEGLAFCNQIKKVNPDYILSSRHRLAIEIQESGFTAVDLSVAAGKNRYYFGTEIKESRFNSRGDLSEKQTILLFGRLEQAIEKLKNPVPEFVIKDRKELFEKVCEKMREDGLGKRDLSSPEFNLEIEPPVEPLNPTGYEKPEECTIKQNQDLAKTNEKAEQNFAKILILVCLILVLSITVKINFF